MSQSIMVVDDDPALRTLISLVLQRTGYTVYQAENGYHAIDLLQICAPDLFLLDVMMPGMDGVELCRYIRASRRMGSIPILIMSARADQASMERGLEAGATEYLCKPILNSDLLRKVQETLASVPAAAPITRTADLKPSTGINVSG